MFCSWVFVEQIQGLKSVDDMTDVLETPKLSKSLSDLERQQIERPLKAAEQLILLSRCHYVSWLWALGKFFWIFDPVG